MRHVSMILAAGSILAIAGAAGAATRHVPLHYSTIQGAINAAASGDEIVVQPGVYNEVINLLGKTLVVRSIDPESPQVRDQTVLDGAGHDFSVISIVSGEGPGTAVRGFTIRGGRGSNDIYRRGGGINVRLSNARIEYCRFLGNEAQMGGAIGGYYSTVEVGHGVFHGNSASATGTNGGGAIGVIGGTTVVLACDFRANATSGGARGGAIAFHTNANGIVENCLFAENHAGYGGAIANWGSTVHLTNCTFSGNTALVGHTLMTVLSHATSWVRNAILDFSDGDAGAHVDSAGSGVNRIDTSLVTSAWPGEGAGNIVADPQFENPDAGDYRVKLSSSAIDAGDNGWVPQPLDDQVDLAGSVRIVNEKVDAGAFERQDVQSEEPDPVGGCCFGSSCVAVTSVQCAAEGGVFLGIDVACETLLCVSSACAADLDGSGAVDFADLVVLLSQWGACPGCSADIDGSWWVDFVDVTLLLSTWGPCP